MSNDKPQWKRTSGLAADSNVAQVVCKEKHKQQWDEEADAIGYSTSQYLYELVQEARALRKDGQSSGFSFTQLREQHVLGSPSKPRSHAERNHS